MVRTNFHHNSNSFKSGGYVPQTINMLSAEREAELWTRWIRDNDMSARSEFLTSYLPLCQKLAYDQLRFNGYNETILPDLFGAAQLGMIEIFDKKKFDPAQGRFSSFAMKWIKSAILNYLMDNKAPFRTCTTKNDRKIFSNFGRASEQVRKTNPSATAHQRHTAIAAILTQKGMDKEITTKDICEFEAKITSSYLSADAELDSDGEGTSLVSRVASDTLTPEDYLVADDYERTLSHMHHAMQALNAREFDIIQKRYLAPETETLHELAATYNVSAERIRQIEVKALQKIRFEMKVEDLPERSASGYQPA